MKNLRILLAAILLISMMISCKKDDSSDRDQFIGTWKGTLNYSIPTLGTLIPRDFTITISAGTGSAQIKISQANVFMSTAAVSNNTYTYDEFTESTTVDGRQATIVYNGKGSLSNKTLTETGTIIYTLGGIVYPGTWTTSLIKQ